MKWPRFVSVCLPIYYVQYTYTVATAYNQFTVSDSNLF